MLSKALETNLCATKCDDDDDDRLSRCARQRTNDLNNKNKRKKNQKWTSPNNEAQHP